MTSGMLICRPTAGNGRTRNLLSIVGDLILLNPGELRCTLIQEGGCSHPIYLKTDLHMYVLETTTCTYRTACTRHSKFRTIENNKINVLSFCTVLGVWTFPSVMYPIHTAPDHPNLMRVNPFQVLARVGNFLLSRIPECTDVEIEDPSQLKDADPTGRGEGGVL